MATHLQTQREAERGRERQREKEREVHRDRESETHRKIERLRKRERGSEARSLGQVLRHDHTHTGSQARPHTHRLRER